MDISTMQLARIDRFLKAEHVGQQTVTIDPIIYRDSAVEGIRGDWDVGHLEVKWGAGDDTCVAHFTGRDEPSFVSRVPR